MKKILIAFYSVLLCLAMVGPGWAAVITRYVNTASTAGGNGTTNETTGDNRAYPTLFAFEAAEQTDLDTANNIMRVYCSGTAADTTAVTIDGWTTSQDDYIDIIGNNTSGKDNTSAYRLVKAGASTALTINEDYVHLTDMQVSGPEYRALSLGDGTAGANKITIKRCIFKALNIALRMWGTTNRVVEAQNSVFVTASSDETIILNGGTLDVYNSVIINGSTGVGISRSNGTCTVKNTYASAGGNDFNGTITQVTNASADTTATGTSLDNIAYSTSSGAYFTNVTSGSEDFHITNTSSSLKGVGTDLSGTFTDDIDGNTRVTWDVGVDYISASSPAATTGPGIRSATIRNAIIR